jgi:hypothetical protein
MKKNVYYFSIVKNLEKSGAWLAKVEMTEPEQPVRQIVHVSAWSSAAPAKRWAASLVNRSRLSWDVSEDGKSMTSTLEVKP